MGKYDFLFPFEKIPLHSKILLYGAGEIAEDYCEQIMTTGYCDIVGIVDRNYKNLFIKNIPVYSPNDINKLIFDYIVLSLKTTTHVKEIRKILRRKGGCDDNVVFIGARKKVENILYGMCVDNREELKLAFTRDRISVAIRLGGGIGDNVVSKRVYDELLRILPKCHLDIYSAVPSEYIAAIFGDNRPINKVLHDLGILYRKNCSRYTLSLSFNGIIRIDKFDYELLNEQSPKFANKILSYIKYQDKHDADKTGNTFADIAWCVYQGYNCYTQFNRGGLIYIANKMTHISLNEIWEDKWGKIRPYNYITVNYGCGVSQQDDSISRKQWPLKYFEKTVELFKKKYPNIKIIQVGSYEASKIKNVDKYFLGENFQLVKHILKNAVFHLDIEGGLTHLATQLGTMCVVIFTITSVKFLGYEQNINIVYDGCNGCFGINSNDIYGCIRNMDKPACIYSITPEIVMNHINDYMRNVNNKR